MTGAPFSHIGGGVIADHGPIALAGARALIEFYRLEARLATRDGAAGWAGRCEGRAVALHGAHEAAIRWRRAAGWADPDAADEACFG